MYPASFEVAHSYYNSRYHLIMSHLPDASFTVPPGDQSVQVRIIDSTTRINNLKLGFLMEPPMEGMKYMPPLPAWSFLIEHPSGQKILYDLGVPKDLQSFSPAICEHLKRQGWKVDVKEEVIDILDRNGIAANEISAIIWRSVQYPSVNNDKQSYTARY